MNGQDESEQKHPETEGGFPVFSTSEAQPRAAAPALALSLQAINGDSVTFWNIHFFDTY